MTHKEQKQCVVVLGMHRSGTSALAGVLHILGMDIGQNLMRPTDDNPKGYFENNQVTILNDRLLEHLGFAWDDPFPFPANWWQQDFLAVYQQQFLDLFQTEFATNRLIGFKDPRICVLLPWWQQVLQQCDLALCYPIIFRHPLEVAASLAKRDRFSVSKSVMLWMKYLLEAERHTRHLPRGFLSFDQLLRHPIETIAGLASVLGISLPLTVEEQQQNILLFIEKDLKHHSLILPEDENSCLPLAMDYYHLLQELSERSENNSAAIFQKIDDLHAQYQELRDWFCPKELHATAIIAKHLQTEIQQLTPHYTAQWFVDTGLGFNERQAITMPVHGQEHTFEFDLSAYRDVKALRFDPLNDLTALHLNSIQLVNGARDVIPIETYQTNACFQNGNNLVFYTPDPTIIFRLPAKQAQKVVIDLEYIATGAATYPYVLQQKDRQLAEQAQALQAQDDQLSQLTPRYLAQLFIDTGMGFNEQQSLTQVLTGDVRVVEFDLSSYGGIQQLRFDPMNDVTVLHLYEVRIVTPKGTEYFITDYQTNAHYQSGQSFVFDTPDPCVVFAAPVKRIRKVIIGLQYAAIGQAAYYQIFSIERNLLQQHQQLLQEQAQALQQKDQQLAEQTQALQAKDAQLSQLTPRYLAQLFIDTGMGFNEQQSLTQVLTGDVRVVEFDLSAYGGIQQLRFDPMNDVTVLHLYEIRIVTPKGTEYFITDYQTNAYYQSGQSFVFNILDPNVVFISPVKRIHKVIIGLQYAAIGEAAYQHIFDLDRNLLQQRDHTIQQQTQALQQKDQQLSQQTQALQAKDTQLSQQAQTLQAKDAQLSQQAQTLQAKDAQLSQQAQALQVKDVELRQKIELIQSMENTLSWKITRPLRTLRNLRFSERRWSYQDPSWKGNVIRLCARTLWPKRLILQSGLFDQEYYLKNNPDVAQKRTNPLRHFVRHGGFEGRKPHPDFDPAYYLTTYPDVYQGGLNPLVHYLLYGGFEGRNPNPEFESASYLEENLDVREAGLNPLVHYVRSGRQEGRRTKSKYRIRYALDKFEVSYNSVALEGWVFSENNPIQTLALCVRQENKEGNYLIEYHLEREDVYLVYKHKNASKSGFAGTITENSIYGKAKIFLCIEFDDGELEYVFLCNTEIISIKQQISVNRNQYLVTQLPQNKKIALYTSSLGNYFFFEIAELIGAGFRELQFQVDRRNEKDGFAQDVDWHIIIASHEFFYLGAGIPLQDQVWPRNTIFFNTEQLSTPWFALASKYFARTYAIWDINYHSSQHLMAQYQFAYYLPLGYVPHFPLFEEVKVLPQHPGTCFLEPAISQHSYYGQPLYERPIDVCFIGHASERRQRFFAKHATVFSKHRCYLHLSHLTGPVIPGQTTYMDTLTVIGLEQRSKILLNIHHGKDVYFEWHRIVMHGIWQKTLVISEPCSMAPPFEPNIDFVVAPLDEIPEKIEYYLSTTAGQQEAQHITEHAFSTLIHQCQLSEFLQSLINSLYDVKGRIKDE